MIAGSVYPVYWHIHHWLMKSSGFRPSDEKVNLVTHRVEEISARVQKTTFRVCVHELGNGQGHGTLTPVDPEPCVWANMVFQTMWFPKIQRCDPPQLTSTPEHPSLHKHSAKAQWDSAADPSCVLWAVTPTCFCEFYRQLQTTVSRMATPTPLNTDPLCSLGGSWEEPSGTQHRDQLSVCVCMCMCVHVC